MCPSIQLIRENNVVPLNHVPAWWGGPRRFLSVGEEQGGAGMWNHQRWSWPGLGELMLNGAQQSPKTGRTGAVRRYRRFSQDPGVHCGFSRWAVGWELASKFSPKFFCPCFSVFPLPSPNNNAFLLVFITLCFNNTLGKSRLRNGWQDISSKNEAVYKLKGRPSI